MSCTRSISGLISRTALHYFLTAKNGSLGTKHGWLMSWRKNDEDKLGDLISAGRVVVLR